MSGIVPFIIFLFLAPAIFVVLIALDSAKKRKLEQDNSCVFDNTEVRSYGRPISNPYIVNPVVKTGTYAVPALKKDRYNKKQVKEGSNKKLLNSYNRGSCTLILNITLTENNKASKRVAKKQKDYSLVNDVYYKAYNEAESMMTDYNAAKGITNNRADLATFEDGYHFDNYAEDFKQESDSENENY